MNSSCQFMDKQPIMDLMKRNKNDTQDQTQLLADVGLEEIVPSYDFQPIRPTTSAARVWSASHDFNPISSSHSPKRGFASLDSIGPSKLVPDKDQNTSILSEIARTMKIHTDTLLHAMEGVSARLTQLETRTHNLEDLLDHLKLSLDNTLGSTHGQMRHLQNILVEVQSGVQLLNDKQDVVEALLQLSKHQVSKVDQHPKNHSLRVDPTAQSPVPVPVTSFPQPPPSAAASSQPHQSSQPPSSQLLAQLPTQFSLQYEPHCPMQSYPPNPPRQQVPAGSAPSQHFYSAPQPQPSMYDGAGGRSNSGFPSEPYSYTGSPMASAKPPHRSSSGTGSPQPSNSRPLPHALPMASAVSSIARSSSPSSESRVPIDDVIDRVTTMGFPREQVRATMRKLTENGQAVDLNVVLDKLMNQGGGVPSGGLFGGR